MSWQTARFWLLALAIGAATLVVFIVGVHRLCGALGDGNGYTRCCAAQTEHAPELLMLLDTKGEQKGSAVAVGPRVALTSWHVIQHLEDGMGQVSSCEEIVDVQCSRLGQNLLDPKLPDAAACVAKDEALRTSKMARVSTDPVPDATDVHALGFGHVTTFRLCQALFKVNRFGKTTSFPFWQALLDVSSSIRCSQSPEFTALSKGLFKARLPSANELSLEPEESGVRLAGGDSGGAVVSGGALVALAEGHSPACESNLPSLEYSCATPLSSVKSELVELSETYPICGLNSDDSRCR